MSDIDGPAPKMPRLDMDGAPRTENTLYFDDPDPNTHDVVINVHGQKFYCVKMTLAKHSQQFYDLFFKDPKHVGKTEFVLGEPANKHTFHMFLNAIHGVNIFDEIRVPDVLDFAILWKCPVAVQLCLDYINDPLTDFKTTKKFEIARRFNLEDMKKKIISEASTCDELHRLVPKNITDLDHATLALIMEKNLALQGLEGRYIPRPRGQFSTSSRAMRGRRRPYLPLEIEDELEHMRGLLEENQRDLDRQNREFRRRFLLGRFGIADSDESDH